MKKRTLFLAMVAVLVSIASCNKEAGNKLAADDGAAIEATFEVSSADVVTNCSSSCMTRTGNCCSTQTLIRPAMCIPWK